MEASLGVESSASSSLSSSSEKPEVEAEETPPQTNSDGAPPLNVDEEYEEERADGASNEGNANAANTNVNAMDQSNFESQDPPNPSNPPNESNAPNPSSQMPPHRQHSNPFDQSEATLAVSNVPRPNSDNRRSISFNDLNDAAEAPQVCVANMEINRRSFREMRREFGSYVSGFTDFEGDSWKSGTDISSSDSSDGSGSSGSSESSDSSDSSGNNESICIDESDNEGEEADGNVNQVGAAQPSSQTQQIQQTQQTLQKSGAESRHDYHNHIHRLSHNYQNYEDQINQIHELLDQETQSVTTAASQTTTEQSNYDGDKEDEGDNASSDGDTITDSSVHNAHNAHNAQVMQSLGTTGMAHPTHNQRMPTNHGYSENERDYDDEDHHHDHDDHDEDDDNEHHMPPIQSSFIQQLQQQQQQQMEMEQSQQSLVHQDYQQHEEDEYDHHDQHQEEEKMQQSSSISRSASGPSVSDNHRGIVDVTMPPTIHDEQDQEIEMNGEDEGNGDSRNDGRDGFNSNTIVARQSSEHILFQQQNQSLLLQNQILQQQQMQQLQHHQLILQNQQLQQQQHQEQMQQMTESGTILPAAAQPKVMEKKIYNNTMVVISSQQNHSAIANAQGLSNTPHAEPAEMQETTTESTAASTSTKDKKDKKNPTKPSNRCRKCRQRFFCSLIVTIPLLLAATAIGSWYYLVYLEKGKLRNGSQTATNSTTNAAMPSTSNGGPVWDGNAPCAFFTVELIIDSFGNETTWELIYLKENTPLPTTSPTPKPTVFNAIPPMSKPTQSSTPQPTKYPTQSPTAKREVISFSEITGKDNRHSMSSGHWDDGSSFNGKKRGRLRQHASGRRMEESSPLSASVASTTSTTSTASAFKLRSHATASEAEDIIVASGGPYPFLENSNSAPIYNTDVTIDNSGNNASNGGTGQYSSSICLQKGLYSFKIHDWNGDGICCRYGLGAYGLHFNGGREIKSLSAGLFMEVEVTEFTVTEMDILMGSRSSSPSVSLVPSVSFAPSMVPSGMPSNATSFLSSIETASIDEMISGISKSYGILFDVEANSNISSFANLRIIGMEFLVDITEYEVTYEVWTTQGSWRDLDRNTSNNPHTPNTPNTPHFSSAFHQVANGTLRGNGVCKNCGYAKYVDLQEDVIMVGGETRAFWVTLNETALVFQDYVEIDDIEDVQGIQVIQGFESGSRSLEKAELQASTAELKVYYGAAVLYYPIVGVSAIDFRYRRGFLGKIWYESFLDTNSTGVTENAPMIDEDSVTRNPSLEPTIITNASPNYSPEPILQVTTAPSNHQSQSPVSPSAEPSPSSLSQPSVIVTSSNVPSILQPTTPIPTYFPTKSTPFPSSPLPTFAETSLSLQPHASSTPTHLAVPSTSPTTSSKTPQEIESPTVSSIPNLVPSISPTESNTSQLSTLSTSTPITSYPSMQNFTPAFNLSSNFPSIINDPIPMLNETVISYGESLQPHTSSTPTPPTEPSTSPSTSSKTPQDIGIPNFSSIVPSINPTKNSSQLSILPTIASITTSPSMQNVTPAFNATSNFPSITNVPALNGTIISYGESLQPHTSSTQTPPTVPSTSPSTSSKTPEDIGIPTISSIVPSINPTNHTFKLSILPTIATNTTSPSMQNVTPAFNAPSNFPSITNVPTLNGTIISYDNLYNASNTTEVDTNLTST